jgi:hypothetical protein
MKGSRKAAVRVESSILSWEPPKAEEMQNLKIEKTR